MFELAKYLKHFKKEVILGPLFKLTEAIFELVVPLIMAKIIDIGIKNSDLSYILRQGGILVLLGIVGLTCALICQYFAAKASQGFGTMVRNDLFAKINSFSHTEIDAVGTASMINRINNDVNQLQVAVAMLIRLVVRAPFLIIGATVMSMFLDLRLSLVFWIAAPLIAATLFLVMGNSIPFYRVIQKKLDKISLITRENLEGVRVIRAFCKQDSEKHRFAEAAEDVSDCAVHVAKISAFLNPVTYIIMNLAIVAIIWFGGMRVNSGVLSQGQIIAFVNYMTQILLALVVVANLVVIFTKASASAARVNEIFHIRPSLVEAPKPLTEIKPIQSQPLLEFKNVSFSYSSNGEDALQNISFQVWEGERIGIIGGTGAGKSTLVQLIPRFYDVTQGEIFLYGINIKKYAFETLRRFIGMVPQKTVLFSGTIRENLSWGNEGITDKEISEALQTAQASEFVDQMDQKYDAEVRQGGKNFSGGQRQRLTIARALASHPKILILDDSSSALVYATEAALSKTLRENQCNMTVITVSQRAHSIQDSDRIIVLDDGIPAGIGTHESLLETCEVYREIVLSQQTEKGEIA